MSVDPSLVPLRWGVVFTGGTIGSKRQGNVIDVATRSGGVTPEEMQLLMAAWPFPEPPEFEIRRPVSRLSENMHPTHWLKIAAEVRDLYEQGYRHITILHGTDTMSYTMDALAFWNSDLDECWDFTGANKGPGEPNSDAVPNLRGAFVAERALVRAGARGGYLAFAGAPGAPTLIHRNTRFRKEHEGGSAFVSENVPEVGSVETDGSAQLSGIPNPPLEADDDVKYVRLVPGQDLDKEATEIIESGYRGVVVELYQSGSGPVDLDEIYSLPALVRRCHSQGIVVVTTANRPAAEEFEYPVANEIRQQKGLFSTQMAPETAYQHLSWALRQYRQPSKVIDLMDNVMAGQIADPAAAAPDLEGVDLADVVNIPRAQGSGEKPIQECDENIKYIKVMPGLNFERAAAETINGGYKGVVVELYPCATGPTDHNHSVPRFARQCVEAGIVVTTAVSKTGIKDPSVYKVRGPEYKTTEAIRRAGALHLGDMLPETAYVKLMFSLGQTQEPYEVMRIMATPIAGEISAPLPMPARARQALAEVT